jgi:hypothetical protein
MPPFDVVVGLGPLFDGELVVVDGVSVLSPPPC